MWTCEANHFVLDLMDTSKRSPSLGGLELDLLSGIKFQPCAIAPNGAVVLKMLPALPTEVDQALRGQETGESTGTFVPRENI